MVERAIAVENSASKVRSIACATFPSSGWSEFQIDSDLQDNPSKADSSASSGRNLLSRGYIKYCQLYSEQEKIRSQAITYKRLHTALHELPNVTSLEFGDNPRSGRLVKDVGEDLMGYCHYPSSWNTVGISAPLHILPHTLIILSGTSLTSLSISCGDLWPKAWAYSSLSGRFAQDMSVHETDQPVLSQVFRSLKSLELRLHAYNGHLEEVQATSKVGDYARAAWSPLRARMCRLELASGQVAQLIGAATNLEHLLLDFGAPFSEWTLWRQLGLPDVHLQSLVGTHVWKHLASLEIVGLGMWPGEMRKFLTPQKALKRIKFHHVGVRQMRWFEAVRVLQRLGLEHIKIREPWGIDIHPYRAWADDDPWILLVEDWILRGSRDGTQPFPLM